MDLWVARHWQRSYDEGGALAAKGRVIESLLDRMLEHEYFSRPAPKSTGRDLFNEAWLNLQLTDAVHCSTSAAHQHSGLEEQQRLDVLATLLALTARSIALHLKQAQFPVTQARADASSAMPSSLPLLAASARALPSATPPSLIPFHH